MLSWPELFFAAFAPFFTVGAGSIAIVVLVALFALLRMRPRRFYLIRHGETLLNAAHIKQGPDGGLSEKGKKQAERVGNVLATFGIERILSSTYERAKETAEIIAARLRVPIRYCPLLVERKNPSEVIGKNRDEPQTAHIVDEIDLAYHPDDYRYSDEENFLDLRERARKCLRYLARQNVLRVCVVTHHAFLKMLLAYMQYGEALHAADYVKLSFFNTSDNGGISIAEYHPWQRWNKTGGWEVVSFNDTNE